MAKDREKKKDKKPAKELRSQSWAVKYRPKVLDDLIGQEAVVAKLKGMLATKNVPAGFLIVGPTGLGKTTVSRMIPRYLNCKTLNACGECENCLISIKQHPDYSEVNIAEEGGKDDLRQVMAKARNRPMVGRFRVILLDEVHQLTGHAAELILKPLEEPPPNTVFILGTSEPEKLKQTVIQRLMPLKMQPISRDLIEKRVRYIAKKEGVDVKGEVFERIAEASGGHMRNAIQLLENVGAAIGGGVTKTKELLATIETDTSTSVDKALDGLINNTLLAALALSLKSHWKIMTMYKGGEEVPFLNNAIYRLQYLIEASTGVKGPFTWHTPANREFAAAVKSLGAKKIDLDKYTGLARATSLLSFLTDLRNAVVSTSSIHRSMLIAKIGEWIVMQKKFEGAGE